jgi:UDP-N-acetylmuramate dehydrogenase
MKHSRQTSLKALNSFAVEAMAANVVRLDSHEDIDQLSAMSFNSGTDLLLGGGSNILFASDVPGTVYLNRLKGRKISSNNGESALVEVASGENWHEFVLWTLKQGLCGLENLSLIPGLAGAAPMQNIGAYGVEISDVLESVQTYDWVSGEIVNFEASDCSFSYRNSRFKSVEPDRFLILSCRMKLSRSASPNISYGGLAEELAAMNVDHPGAREVSEAVIKIRRRKLPDPALIGNAGSFFKNPEITLAQADEIRSKHPKAALFRVNDDLTKVSAAWMIENCGWKGFREGDAGVSDQHALVLVNYGAASGLEILKLSDRISESVNERFGITLEREPQLFKTDS